MVSEYFGVTLAKKYDGGFHNVKERHKREKVINLYRIQTSIPDSDQDIIPRKKQPKMDMGNDFETPWTRNGW